MKKLLLCVVFIAGLAVIALSVFWLALSFLEGLPRGWLIVLAAPTVWAAYWLCRLFWDLFAMLFLDAVGYQADYVALRHDGEPFPSFRKVYRPRARDPAQDQPEGAVMKPMTRDESRFAELVMEMYRRGRLHDVVEIMEQFADTAEQKAGIAKIRRLMVEKTRG